MIDTKFKNADDKTSLQALWIEVEQLDVKRGLDRALLTELTERIKEVEDARQVQIRLNREFREAIGKNVKLTTPEKKTLWEIITGQ